MIRFDMGHCRCADRTCQHRSCVLVCDCGWRQVTTGPLAMSRARAHLSAAHAGDDRLAGQLRARKARRQ